jgi:hypothetical protein
VKKGKQSGRQRYVCKHCGHQFQNKRRKNKLDQKLWREYVQGKQTAQELGDKYGKCRQWVSSRLAGVDVGDNQDRNISDIAPGPITIVGDVTFFTWNYGILVFREPNLKRNLIWKEVRSETPGQYRQLMLELKSAGFSIQAAVLDGKRGVKKEFSGIPVQMCQFHQVAIVTRYLTRNPISEAGRELRAIALALTSSTEEEFRELLDGWRAKWEGSLKEKTAHPITGGRRYVHKRVRSAHRSLETNLPYLFTHQRYPELNIPNTCNCLDGCNTTLKNLVRVHRGINRDKRYKMICEILRNSYPKKLT